MYYSSPTWSKCWCLRFVIGHDVIFDLHAWLLYTTGNHLQIFDAAHVAHKTYRYWDAAKRRLDIEGMLADIEAAPQGSVMLLHACAHNPTGTSLTMVQYVQHVCWP